MTTLGSIAHVSLATEIRAESESGKVVSTLFLGYSSQPELTRETMHLAGRELASTGMIDVVSWEDLRVAGRVIIGRVLEAIDESSACAFDVSTLNENVLFELGYAITRAKPVCLLLDKTDTEAKRRWREFELLKSVGYVGWANAEDLKVEYLKAPFHLMEDTLYDDLIEPNLDTHLPGSLFYVPAYHNTEAARQIDRRLNHELHRGVRVLSADPTESSLNPLSWYANKAYEAECTLIHFESPRRELSSLHNPRSALVAGMARGLDRPLLMLAENDYSPPLDYEGMLRLYSSSQECRYILDAWLRDQNLQPRAGARTTRLKLATELRALRFGEHVAENEIDTLSDYFIETASFDDVIASRNTLFIGRKGTGKTANMLQAASRLSEDARNLMIVIKPASYEFSSLLVLLGSLPVSLQQYSIEGLWKYLLTSQIASEVVDVVEGRPSGIPYTEDEKRLLEFVDTAGFDVRDDFGARFERTIKFLQPLEQRSASEAGGRDFLNEALHTEAIARLRSLLGPVLRSRQRVALLIDNLDKGWERSADLDLLAKLLLGLLSATGRVSVDFAREDYWRERVTLTVATFLRSDIFSHVLAQAREPDKIPASVVSWEDPAILIRVLEERFLAARPPGSSAEELWSEFFCDEVRGLSPRQYLASHVLPRPRDLIYIANAAVGAATNRGHARVEADDILSGELSYSQFAFESLLVENGLTISEFKDVLFEFLGETAVLPRSRVLELVGRAGVDSDAVGDVVDRLRAVSFLGVETATDRFDYPEPGHASERADVMARKVVEDSSGDTRYCVHPAFRAYLEMSDPEAGAVEVTV